MLKITIVCVGNIKDKFFQEAQDEYIKRISKYASVVVKEIKEFNHLNSVNQIIEQESELILETVKSKYILLDICGIKLDSVKFSKYIEDFCNMSGELTFVIGGSYGVSEKVKMQAYKRISFSDMTFPHRLFRIMLLEQIYRAFCISNNTPYHK